MPLLVLHRTLLKLVLNSLKSPWTHWKPHLLGADSEDQLSAPNSQSCKTFSCLYLVFKELQSGTTGSERNPNVCSEKIKLLGLLKAKNRNSQGASLP